MKKVLITEEVHESLIKGITSFGFVCDYYPGITQQEVLNSINAYTGIVVATRISIDRDFIDRAVLLSFIARAGSGMEKIDVDYALEKNIRCINSPEGNANSVGEHCIGLLLAMFHNITKSFYEIKNGKWLVKENYVHELEGKTIAIIGYGNTGKSFAEKLKPFGMNVIAYDRYLQNFGDQFVKQSDMQNIFETADIVSLHIPLNEQTEYMVNGEYLQRFANNIHLINTSRGKIIKHSDLLELIRSGKIVMAALDVYENENIDSQNEDEKMLFQELTKSEKVIFTPHVAGKSFESKKKIANTLLRKIFEIG